MAWLGVLPVLVWLSLAPGWTREEDLRSLLIRSIDENQPQSLSRIPREQVLHQEKIVLRGEDGDLKDDPYYTEVRWPEEEGSTVPGFFSWSPKHWNNIKEENQTSDEHFRSEIVKNDSETSTPLHWRSKVEGDDNFNHSAQRMGNNGDSVVAASHHWSHGGGEDHHSDHHDKHGHKAHKGYESKHHNDHGKKGHHDKEGSSGHHEEHGGHKKKHHDEGGYHKVSTHFYLVPITLD